MKVKLKQQVETEQEFDVEFPVYRKHDVGGDDYESIIYTRIDKVDRVFKMCSIQEHLHYNTNTKTVTLEIEKRSYFADSSTADYCLGRGEYALTKEEWNMVYTRTCQFLIEVEGLV